MFTICIMIGTSYAWWTSTANQTGINEIQSTCIEMKLTDEKDEINLEYAYPLTDEEAKKLKPFTFTIKNSCNTIVDYTVKLEQLKKNGEEDAHLLNSKYVAVEFNEGQKQILSEYPEGVKTYKGNEGYTSTEARELIKGTLEGSATKEYQIKLWMDESVEATQETMNKSFISKIVVDGSINEVAVYDEPILHGADPVLESNKPIAMQTASEAPTTTDKLIPVIINEENGKVTRANLAHDWYNYEEKRWANAVILADGATEPEVGKEIPEEQIESYFVWIPKYSYKIQTIGVSSINNEKAFEIQFGTENTTDTNESCKTPMKSGESGACVEEKWMTHPAFISFDVNGLWVGKFETGYKQDGDQLSWNKEEAQKNEQAPTKVIIKPNVYNWRAMTLNNMFTTAKGYKENLDSHMMKNTEWGAVAYLTQSIYGRCKIENGSTNCTEVGINGTGYTTGYYNANQAYPNSSNASTNENNTGIFDMRGGASDMVIGFKMSSFNEMSQFIKNEASIYYDIYNDDTLESNYRILGDATAETHNWYGDYAYFGNILFIRGGHGNNGTQSGMFSFYSHNDNSDVNDTFRIVLAPQ